MSQSQSEPNTSTLGPGAVIKLPELSAFLGLSRFEITKLSKENKFPRYKKLSNKTLIWKTDDVLAWVDSIGQGNDIPDSQIQSYSYNTLTEIAHTHIEPMALFAYEQIEAHPDSRQAVCSALKQLLKFYESDFPLRWSDRPGVVTVDTPEEDKEAPK